MICNRKNSVVYVELLLGMYSFSGDQTVYCNKCVDFEFSNVYNCIQKTILK